MHLKACVYIKILYLNLVYKKICKKILFSPLNNSYTCIDRKKYLIIYDENKKN